MGKVGFKIIKLGLRIVIFKARNASLILFGLTLIVFIIGESVTSEMSPSRTIIAYIFMISIAALVVTLLLSVILLFKRTVGNIAINGDIIFFTEKEKTIKLSKLQIILNADTFELGNSKKNSKDRYRILRTGNRIVSEDLPSEQNEWELILTRENKKELLELENKNIILTPQFDSRPILMESPGRLFKTIMDFGQGWG